MMEKRKRTGKSNEVEGVLTKKIKLTDVEQEKNEFKITDFSDDILLIILNNLRHDSLISLSLTCQQFRRICQDHTLWRHVKYNGDAITRGEMNDVLNFVWEGTQALSITGDINQDENAKELVTNEWMKNLNKKCTSLTFLELPRHCINCEDVLINDFPKNLTHLNLSYTKFKKLPLSRSYFRDISRIMPELKTLILSHCEWFEPHSLMAISKCPCLEELFINDCPQVKDCLAYCGLSTRGGFRALRTLDMRRCYLNCSELVCFSSVESLVNLYLENPSVSAPRMCHIDQAIVVLFTQQDVVEIRVIGEGYAPRPYIKIEKLVVRNFPLMTDASLQKLASDAKGLRYLDISGSGVTSEGINQFKVLRPSVTVVSEISPPSE